MPSSLASATCRRLVGLLALAVCHAATADAQDRRYLLEVGAGGSANSFDAATDLSSAPGAVVRVGLWLPFHVSVEGEVNLSSPTAEAAGQDVKVRTLGAAALYNVPVGGASSFYVKAGAGTTSYGGDCPPVSTPGSAICGSSGTILLGGGLRFGITPSLMIRGEALYSGNRTNSVNLANYGVNVGVSAMLGSRPLPDSDRDGVPNNRDRCAGTTAGVPVDSRGCTVDDDNDGVPNGVDRCADTPAGATVDGTGCPKDSDNDNILDGLDRCPGTPAGVLVDPQGCPRDSDKDGIPDGLDRCSATPVGATVDALGCPGDEDGDGVLDGLDACPRSAIGATVDAKGCAQGQTPRRAPAPAPTPAPTPTPTPPNRPAPEPIPRPAPAPADPARRPARTSSTIDQKPSVLPNVMFFTGTARLNPSSHGTLDSIATILLADSTLVVEIGGHSDALRSPAETARLTTLQAEAVRTFLMQKGVPVQQVVARGYGASVPLTPDTTPAGLLRNRRIEIRRLRSTP